MSEFRRKLLILSVLTTICCLFGLLVRNPAVGVLTAVPLILYLPGASLLMAIDVESNVFGNEMLGLWTVGGSIVVVVLGGLFLNLIGGLDRLSWLIYLVAVTAAFVIVALIRDSRLNGNTRTTDNRILKMPAHTVRLAATIGAILLLGLIVTGSKYKADRIVLHPSAGENFTADSIKDCSAVHATSTIHFTVSRDSLGDFSILALGTVTNHSSLPLHYVVVTWVVTYADETVGIATKSPVTDWVISPLGTGNWGSVASFDDGSVPPTGVRIIKIIGSTGSAICND